MRSPRARINRNRKSGSAPLGTGSTNCLLAYSFHLVHANASLHRIRLPPTGVTTKRHTRWIRIYIGVHLSSHKNAPLSWPFLDFLTGFYFILSSRYWYIKYRHINNGIRESKRKRSYIAPIKILSIFYTKYFWINLISKRLWINLIFKRRSLFSSAIAFYRVADYADFINHCTAGPHNELIKRASLLIDQIAALRGLLSLISISALFIAFLSLFHNSCLSRI